MCRNFLLGLLVFVTGCSASTSAPTAAPESKPHQQVLEQYFETAMAGKTGESFWCPGENISSLFSVRSYKLLREEDAPFFGEGGKLMVVQVESSNQGGSPIVQNWNFALEQKEGRYCIDDIYEPRNDS